MPFSLKTANERTTLFFKNTPCNGIVKNTYAHHANILSFYSSPRIGEVRRGMGGAYQLFLGFCPHPYLP